MSTASEIERPGTEQPIKVRRALISVSDKTGIVEFARGLANSGVEILSTGGTAAEIREAGIDVTDVSEFTGSPEILDGRVKTLHPRLHAALLARRDDPAHMQTLREEGIEPIELVCVNLYPFEQTVARLDVSEAEALENIDIGGPTMIRAAAKNHCDVAVVVSPESYDAVIAELEESNEISGETRHWLANEAFAHTAAYDAAISGWLGQRYEVFPTHLTSSFDKFLDLSYGENPHQRAALYVERGVRAHVLSRVSKLHGRPLSFNNVLDLDNARRILSDIGDEPACVIVKHNNPCGAAQGKSAAEAYEKALACDPLSAFGGVIALNRPIDPALAKRLHENFVEVLIAPGYDAAALEVLQQKEAIRILGDDERRRFEDDRDTKRVRGGILVQEHDRGLDTREGMQVVTKAIPTDEQWEDLIFAWKICRHVRSNAIVFARGVATVGIGAGQMSRVDSVEIAVSKASRAFGDEPPALAGSAVASDAFYPFADGPMAAVAAGATSLIQPGGSKRDDEVIAACDEAGVTMVFTGRRHFRH